MKTDDKSVRVGVQGESSWTITGSGVKVEYLAPDVSMINLDDICHHTSQICRFTGGTKYFYSVAQHCVLVGKLIADELDETGAWQYDTVPYWNQILAGLLHDAAEAYTSDIASPLKEAIAGRYKEIEMGLLEKVFEKFDVSWDYHNSIVKWADNTALQIERYYLMPDHPDWPKVPASEMVYPRPLFTDPITARLELATAIHFVRRKRESSVK